MSLPGNGPGEAVNARRGERRDRTLADRGASPNPYEQRAAHLNDKASATFDEGTDARETGEKYVRNTVLFAMVLFLVAIAQRFKDRTLRTAVNIIAVAVLTFALVSILTLPRMT